MSQAELEQSLIMSKSQALKNNPGFVAERSKRGQDEDVSAEMLADLETSIKTKDDKPSGTPEVRFNETFDQPPPMPFNLTMDMSPRLLDRTQNSMRSSKDKKNRAKDKPPINTPKSTYSPPSIDIQQLPDMDQTVIINRGIMPDAGHAPMKDRNTPSILTGGEHEVQAPLINMEDDENDDLDNTIIVRPDKPD